MVALSNQAAKAGCFLHGYGQVFRYRHATWLRWSGRNCLPFQAEANGGSVVRANGHGRWHESLPTHGSHRWAMLQCGIGYCQGFNFKKFHLAFSAAEISLKWGTWCLCGSFSFICTSLSFVFCLHGFSLCWFYIMSLPVGRNIGCTWCCVFLVIGDKVNGKFDSFSINNSLTFRY